MERIGPLVIAVGAALAVGVGIAPPAWADTDSASAPDAAKRGEQLFVSTGCGFCHEGGGRTAGKGPKLAASERTDSFIVFRIKHGKEGAMPAWNKVFNDAQIADLLAYIRSLKD
jgi:mono/diheme cytochrome c family protein